MKIVRVFTALAVAVGTATTALAQGYPTKPVHLIVGLPPGSVPDTIARSLSSKLSEAWGQPIVIENRLGAAGVIAAGVVARSPADGHTLLVHGAYAVNAALAPNLPYDPLKDFVAITPLASQPFVLIVGLASGVRTVAELIAAAKVKPGQLNYGSPGIGSLPHLGVESFKLTTGIDVAHVPYKGPAEVITDLIAGRITFAYSPIQIALPHIRSGRLSALGVSGERRSSLLPDVPTLAEAGVSGFTPTLSVGVWAPAGTPADVVDRISRDVSRALATPDARDELAKLGAEPMRMSPSEFAQFIRREIHEMTRIVKAAGITPE